MLFIVQSNDNFNFLLGWIKYIVIVSVSILVAVCWCSSAKAPEVHPVLGQKAAPFTGFVSLQVWPLTSAMKWACSLRPPLMSSQRTPSGMPWQAPPAHACTEYDPSPGTWAGRASRWPSPMTGLRAWGQLSATSRTSEFSHFDKCSALFLMQKMGVLLVRFPIS